MLFSLVPAPVCKLLAQAWVTACGRHALASAGRQPNNKNDSVCRVDVRNDNIGILLQIGNELFYYIVVRAPPGTII